MPPKSSGGGKKSKAAKQVTNKRRRGFVDPDLKVSKRQAKKDDAKFVRAKFGNFQGVAPSSDALGGSSRGDDAAASSSSSDDEDAIAVADRIHANVAKMPLLGEIGVTITLGVATGPGEDLASSFARALRALEEAVRGGADAGHSLQYQLETN